MTIPRLLRSLVTCLLAVLPAIAAAQPFPSKPIRVFVGFAPGGGTDIIARAMAQELTTRLGVAVVVENRPGAGTAIAMEAVAKAAPDGYTLLWGSDSSVVQPLLRKGFPVDPFKDLTPLVRIGVSPLILVVGRQFAAGTLEEFVKMAKAKPGSIRYGSGGNGTAQHISMEIFKLRAGIDLLHIPYKGTGPAIADLLGGHVDVVVSGVGEAVGPIQSGDLRGLAVGSEARVPQIPAVPTYIESGYRDYTAGSWQGVMGPAGLPGPVATALADHIVAASQTPAFTERMSKFGMVGPTIKGAEMAKYMRTLADRTKAAIDKAGIKVE